MRIAIDATPILNQPTGVGTFVRGLLNGELRDHSLELVAYGVSGRRGKQLRSAVPQRVAVAKKRMTAGVLFRLWARGDWPKIERYTGRVDVVHGTNVIAPPTRGATVITVHDLTCIRYPQMCVGISKRYPEFIRTALRRGAFIHTPSHYVANEVCEVFDVSPERVTAIAHGAPQQAVVQPVEERTIFELVQGAPYILAVGTIEPRKDYPALIEAFARMQLDDDIRLVIAGTKGWGADAVTARIDELGLGNRVVMLGYVDDHLRAALFSGATLFVYPSIYEGFGFPPLEAMRTHTPVITTRAGAVPEVCGDGALLVDVGDVDALKDAMEQVLTDETIRRELVEAGDKRIELYDWTTSADQMIDLYDRARHT